MGAIQHADTEIRDLLEEHAPVNNLYRLTYVRNSVQYFQHSSGGVS